METKLSDFFQRKPLTYFCLLSGTDCNNYECCYKTYDYFCKIYNLIYEVKNRCVAKAVTSMLVMDVGDAIC